MKRIAAINIVGLSSHLIGEHMPQLKSWMEKGAQLSTINPVLPAVTCAAQSTYLTGKTPADHGIVANGWYFRDECEVKLWRQSNKLVEAEKIWEKAKQINPEFTCANMFWWYNMYSTVDYSVTPRPQYLADGRKMPDCYSHPASLRDELQEKLGTFPLFSFWGPNTSVKSSRWIAQAAQHVFEKHQPTLTLIYLPHLDYCLQKYDHNSPQVQKDLLEIDALCYELIQFFEQRDVQPIVLSGYGITPVSRPIHINRILRRAGLIQVRIERGLELLDAGASQAFAMADHQIAHVYVNDPTQLEKVRALLAETPGVAQVLDAEGKKQHHLNHPRSGELVAVAEPDSWFTYYYWLDDKKAPDFARKVEIHRKPGYDPAEMFLDPDKSFIYPRIAWKVLKKKLGFRMNMDVIPLRADLVKGSHGAVDVPERHKPIFITKEVAAQQMDATAVCDILLQQIFD
ncbi:MAG: alkaline phosphatase family protein [Saprospiraceae bacterium]|nr:alkaline phosphatase family protein [Saprospiraceae bacterium]